MRTCAPKHRDNKRWNTLWDLTKRSLAGRSTTTLVSQDLYKIGVTARLKVRLTRLQAYKSRWSWSCSKIGVSRSSGTRSLMLHRHSLPLLRSPNRRSFRASWWTLLLVDPLIPKNGSVLGSTVVRLQDGRAGFSGTRGIVEWGGGE
jgi:hypothetical protein